MGKILLIDDDTSLLRVTEYNLKEAGFDVVCADSATAGIDKFRSTSPSLVVTDIQLGDINGLEVLKTVKEESPDTPVIMITAFGSIEMAVEAMKKGAFNFITKPFDRDTLRLSCKKALELASLRDHNRLLSEEVNRLTGADGIETANREMQEVVDTALAVSGSEATVLITGESGTGKEVLARLIHQKSGRREKAMVVVNCAAIPETLIESELFGHVKGAFTGAASNRKGKFLSAHGGTLFLDEISELKTDMQAKLLRAIQEKEIEPVGSENKEKIDIRIIAASNKNLKQLTESGSFREDLYYRLSVIPLHLPPLRNRKEDIAFLLGRLLKKFGAPDNVKFSKEALKAIEHYSWPGNIRELQNTVERCLILRKSSVIGKEDLNLSAHVSSPPPVFDVEIPDDGISLEEVERRLIESALNKSNGNRSEAARLLKIPRHILIYRMEKFGI